MKHTLKVTLFLILIFLCSQLVGIAINSSYIDYGKTADSGKIIYKNLPFNVERPEMSKTGAVIYILFGVLLGTAFLLLLIRFKRVNVWKVWYFIAILMCLVFAFGAILPETIALVLALGITIFKLFKPNVFIHNMSEIFIYGGLAVIFVPLLNVLAAVILLLIISVYDMIAVWKSKHMITLAKFQSSTKLFAGLSVGYDRKKNTIESKIPATSLDEKKGNSRTAIVGGGDVAFPVIFSSVVLQKLIVDGVSFIPAFFQAALIGVFATIALGILLFKSESGKFYPAMPFITAGCLVGYAIVLLINLI